MVNAVVALHVLGSVLSVLSSDTEVGGPLTTTGSLVVLTLNVAASLVEVTIARLVMVGADNLGAMLLLSTLVMRSVALTVPLGPSGLVSEKLMPKPGMVIWCCVSVIEPEFVRVTQR